jgi:uncharacterized membrane protein
LRGARAASVDKQRRLRENALMFERHYRRRLDADLLQWQANGTISPAAGDAIRQTLGPMPGAIGVATMVGIAGGLLIAAAFLAFVAANWSAIPRFVRLGMLLGGIAGAHGLGAWFARRDQPYLADTAVAVGAIVFGASIALVGQMYHLAGDFAAAMLVWALGALAAAVLIGSRGALAVALVTACLWSGARAFPFEDMPHLPFVPFWLVAAALALLWNSAPARHLVALAALVWWAETGTDAKNPAFVWAAGTALVLGGGLLAHTRGSEQVRALGEAGEIYAAFAMTVVLTVAVADLSRPSVILPWLIACGVLGVVLAAAASTLVRRPSLVLQTASIALMLLAAASSRQDFAGSEWLTDAAAIAAPLCLIISGMLDDTRARIAAGWIGLAVVIAAITWTVRASLLGRSLFLALAGGAAIVLALALGRLLPRESSR